MNTAPLTHWYAQKANRLHPGQLIFLSYMLAIGVGTLLLSLPIATVSGSISWADALFTATSATCVTGLSVLDIGTYFTLFGQLVILALIQLGGLGIMTFSVAIFRLIGRKISFRERMAVQDVFTHTAQEDVYQLLKSIFFFTLGVESLGFLLLFLFWSAHYPLGEAFYLSVFHAISAFCHAGFSLFENSLMDFRGNLFINTVIGTLIILGGIGFPVVYDLYHTYFTNAKVRKKLLAQTKVVLLMTAILVPGAAILFWALEQNNTLQGLPWNEAALSSLFQSIATRSAGLNTLDIGALKDSTLAMFLFLMFFGGAPGSCAGGVKITTLALIGAFAWSRFRQERRVNVFKKSVPADTLTKSVVLILISIALITLFFFLLLVFAPTEIPALGGRHIPFRLYLFEAVSAFGTVGLSMGVTPYLTPIGKLLLILMMLIGRVGVLTIAYVVVGPTATKGIEYAEENIMVG